jgi:hypothetical protein
MQQGAFARTRTSDDGDSLTGGDVQTDALQHADGITALSEGFDYAVGC